MMIFLSYRFTDSFSQCVKKEYINEKEVVSLNRNIEYLYGEKKEEKEKKKKRRKCKC
jgi:hypothetical protein